MSLRDFDTTRTPRDYKAEKDMQMGIFEEFADNPYFFSAFWHQLMVDNFGYARLILEEFYEGFT